MVGVGVEVRERRAGPAGAARVTDDDDRAQPGQLPGDRLEPAGVLGLHDRHAGAGVLDDVPQPVA